MILSLCFQRWFAIFIILLAVPSAHALVILQYHHVSTKTPPSTSISPSVFKQHMQAIEDASFTVMDMRTFADFMRGGKALPAKTVVITFDDGYRSVYQAAYPELKRRKWPFTVFINTDPHDEKNPLYMSWEELRELSDNGTVIANHTLSHAHLIRGKFAPSAAGFTQSRKREIDAAEDKIKQKLGISDKLFAYPYGEYDERLKQSLKASGYLAFGQQSGPVAKNSDHQAIPRFPFGGPYGDIEGFKTKLMSLAFPETRIKVTSEKGVPLSEPLLPAGVSKPILRIASPILPHIGAVNCYASGQGKIKSEKKGGVIVAMANKPLAAGRSRYNCTSHAGNGRYYWHSEFFIRKRADGSWVSE